MKNYIQRGHRAPTQRLRVLSALLALLALTTSGAIAGRREHRLVVPRATSRTWLFLRPEQLTPAELDRRLLNAAESLTPRALARRMKSLGWPPVRPCDLPPSADRLAAIERAGCRVVRAVRYVSALVIEGNAAAVAAAARLPFVLEARPVMAFPTFPPPASGGVRGAAPRDDPDDYGQGLRQAALVNLPAVHDAGYRGRGVLIGVQDTGFDNLRHRCFRRLQVVAAWDFLNDDGNVGDQGDVGRGQHGTRTLSVLAGLDSGRFIGAAPDAQFVLTKTENSESETPVEEDFWVAGLWFHDSLGVDVLSSSLSYREWYDYPDFDGRTAVTTRAADSAAAAGMVIVNSIGNTGGAGYPYSKMGAPADAARVISVGGVTRDSSYWPSSSQGPTYDGRLKPDVVALASGAYTAVNLDDSTYYPRSGTSFSCPMVAGVAALIIEANPDLTPAQVMDILHRTAGQADSPDTLLGYGIVNALAAVRRAEAMAVRLEPLLPVASKITLFPNPANGRVTIVLRDRRANESVRLVDGSGRLVLARPIHAESPGVWTFDAGRLPAGSYWVGVQSGSWRPLVVVK